MDSRSEPPPHGYPGQLLAGKYQLEQEIGRGGMGVVWLAQRRDWAGAHVALKLMHRVDTPIARERFAREVNLMAMLRSPYVVQVLDHGVDEATGALFIVMEHLEGESLGTRLRRLQVLSPGEVMMIVTHLGRALSRAHAAGVIHRDLKPDNIFLVRNHNEPIVKVLDFGLAKPFEAMIDSRAVTVPGNAVGTPWYMSPEQIRGATPDHTGDLWSVAVIACECLVGKTPFHAPDLANVALRLWKEDRPVPSQLGDVPQGFDEWFAKATHRDVDQRYQSAEEVVEALARVCDSSRNDMPPVHSQRRLPPARSSSLDPVTRPPESRTLFTRRSTLLAGVLAGSVLAIGGSAYLFSSQVRSGVPPRGPLPSFAQQPITAALPVLPSPSIAPGPSAAMPPEPPSTSAPVLPMEAKLSPSQTARPLLSEASAPAANPVPPPAAAKRARAKPRVSPSSRARRDPSSRETRPTVDAISPNEPLDTEF